MKLATRTFAWSVLALSTAGLAFAQPAPPIAAPKCLSVYDIASTHAIDAGTVLFKMRDGTVLENRLHGRCPGLRYYGFVYQTRDVHVCANMQSIKVLASHETCLLGDFFPYSPPPHDHAT